MKKCIECGKEFQPKNNKGVFCSNKCRQKDFRKMMQKLAKMKKEELKFAKSVPEKKGHKYPLEQKDVFLQDEFGQTGKVEPLKINEKEKQERIRQLEYELSHAPKTFSVSGMKEYYFNSRQTELKKLKSE